MMTTTTQQQQQPSLVTTTLNAPDISCGGCANAIKKALGSVSGVSVVAVDIDSKNVTFSYDDRVTSPSVVAAALDRAGFPVSE